MKQTLKCDICGTDSVRIYTNKNKFKKNLCNKHYTQLRIYGKILDLSDEYIEEIDCILVKVRNGWAKSNKITLCKISKSDLEFCRKYKWHISGTGYMATTINRKTFLFHQLIMNYDSSILYCDHINREKLDNRRENLRIVTNQQNLTNRGLNSKNKTGYNGVEFLSKFNKYRAGITSHYKTYYSKLFDNISDAIEERKRLESIHWK